MNETQIESGSELNALIAQDVMGWQPPDSSRAYAPSQWLDAKGNRDWPPYRAFSSSYEGMGLVLERMQALGWSFSTATAPEFDWWAEFTNWQLHHGGGNFRVRADTLPHAVALAALAAVRATAAL